MSIKREYILVDSLFDEEESDYRYEDLGIKPPIEEAKAFNVLPRIIFTDKIIGFGPGNLMGVTDIHMIDGYSFRVKGTIEEILCSIYPEADLSIFGPTEEDFEI